MNEQQINPKWVSSCRLSDFPVCADGFKPIPAFKNLPTLDRMPFAQMMLMPEKIEAVLKMLSMNSQLSV